ncbi:SNARE domain anchored protein [Nitzschia inconspicua]|uniref:SNARE domain anchored protein n=1 Tax=Nitzschia inconspicua TaxID=303405 RepID=A0A9K3PIP7_9STRA|nr:SNARE domain anchored protein [Nitzschia inconspicua]
MDTSTLFAGRKEEPKQQPQQQQLESTQRQEQQLVSYNRDEEYRDAQRAAVEAISIGRETLETAVRQGEQLQNAENLADETEYKLDKANRLLKGMTWAGWLSNKFSRDVEPPTFNTDGTISRETRSILGPPKVYEDVPKSCSGAAQAIQNYHANLQVLEDCETDEQIATCKLICDNMHEHAVKEVETVRNESDVIDAVSKNFAARLQSDIETLRGRQLALQQMRRGLTGAGTPLEKVDKIKLFSDAKQNPNQGAAASPLDQVKMQQEEHLDSMAKHLRELGSLAGHLNLSLATHSETLDSLDEKNDSLLFKTKMVTRRADRLIQKKAWVQEKAEFVMTAWIQHQSSGKYLSVAPNNDSTLVLSSVLNERCIFGVWKRKSVYGLQNQYNRRWAGQSLLGQLTCSANSFGRREEWDMDDGFSDTTLVVASAGWGHGGYLLLDEKNPTLPIIGGGTLEDKKKAPKWTMKAFEKK